ncbi:haloacid dehalogenase type II (plasmid) [Georgenia sp. TF02-10]|uniref:haloacid dehalogenase type II n=1 Tax=Georgenia sp. TF02-10 TaxID=2917725 RepID=UPI001FA71398|nr:haloacid dehalogenase type II [Georgenia sp. TF02-10]UNX56623.1 haloacid dehalogenase type II [Georgenia sp. TF02-10]
MASSNARGVARPEVLVFDVNQTLSDMAPVAALFEDVGAPAHQAQRWFAELLRDGFALTAAGSSASFAEIGAEILRTTLDEPSLDRGLEEAVRHIMAGFGQLPVHADVPDGVRDLTELGVRLVTMSNGATSVAAGLLERAGILGRFERLLSAEESRAWKPARSAYTYAVEQCAVAPGEAMLVAVHPWDIDGAARAGLRTAWLDRADSRYPAHFTAPEVRVTSLSELADHLR